MITDTKPQPSLRRPSGRPLEFNQAAAEIILDLLQKGNFLETAATYAGVTARTVRNWMRWGRHRRSAELAEFYKRVMQARAMAEVADLEKIKAATDWKATAWRMERRNPKAWGRKRVITIHTGTQRRRRSREEIEREMADILGEDHASVGG